MHYAIISYNNSIHTSTNKAPIVLLLGHMTARDPFNLYYEKMFYRDYVELSDYEKVSERMKTRKDNLINRRNQDTEPTTFEVGQQIYSKILSSNRNKTTNKFEGPFEILEVNSDNTVVISKNNRRKRVHMKNLRKPMVDVPGGASQPP